MEDFQYVFKEFEAMIHHILHSLHIYKNYDEFFQIGLIALWEARRKFDPSKGAFSSYAYMTIKGRVLSEMKKSAIIDDRQLYPKEEFWDYQQEECAVEPLEIETLLAYCTGLTKNQIKWVVATFYLGMSVAEIATYEEVSESAVKKWKRGAMEKIRVRVLNGSIHA
ncbi:sigma-70 family RNA polymerase sigma factor [Bacillus sp. FJAT-49736]|uniref:sigma-70 family RNA polymerase sigma factor n=1 Tax=Bacillus sp. FJAT-49736 TaxID=2833582 RepID=UPI001BC96EBC|nr:sigma-70 family RNA polymerase sigma factor [Bacillus sp. FJAT-49736]MBS4174237.1 sigma-70 family RNA polymerase sigma factor [Bacillus sp. FJAT-49736]